MGFMDDLQLAGLEMNAKTKLNAIKISNPLYYHLIKGDFERENRLYKSNKLNSNQYVVKLEKIIDRLDDIMRGADQYEWWMVTYLQG